MIIDRFHFFPVKNKEIGSLYFTSGLVHFAEGLVSIFIPIYLWMLGFPITLILLFYFLYSFYFVISAFLFLKIIKHMTDKWLMLLSVPFGALFFLGLTLVPEYPFTIYLLPILLVGNMLLFNLGYHLDFTHSMDNNHVGVEVGGRFSVMAIARFTSPVVGGSLIALFGFEYNFMIAAGILLLAILPLFYFPQRKISADLTAKSLWGQVKEPKLWPFNLSAAGFANEKIIGIVIWPLFIFLIIGDIEQFGGVISFGLLASAVISYIVGFVSDHGRRRKALLWFAIILSLVWLLRAMTDNPSFVMGLHALGQIALGAILVAWHSQFYKLSRIMRSPSGFILSREILLNITRCLFIPLLMLCAYLLSLESFFTVSFIGAAAVSLLYIFANRQHQTVFRQP